MGDLHILGHTSNCGGQRQVDSAHTIPSEMTATDGELGVNSCMFQKLPVIDNIAVGSETEGGCKELTLAAQKGQQGP